MLSFLFSTKKRQLTDRELTACYSKGAALLTKAKSFSGLWDVLELAQELNRLLSPDFMLQVPGCGTITQSKEGLILAYVNEAGKIIRYTIAKRDY